MTSEILKIYQEKKNLEKRMSFDLQNKEIKQKERDRRNSIGFVSQINTLKTSLDFLSSKNKTNEEDTKENNLEKANNC